VYSRVFGLSHDPPDLAALLEHFHARGLAATGSFRGDDLGWTGGEIVLRDDLNTWAGWLETRTDQPRHGELMQHVIGTKQLITLRPPPDGSADRLCDEVCRWLAAQTQGVYQVDGRGFFAADGTLLLADES
jgi:hypothetical protein